MNPLPASARSIVTALVIAWFLATSAYAQKTTATPTPSFVGQWACEVEGEAFDLTVSSARDMTFAGERMSYRVEGDRIFVSQQGVVRPHQYRLQGRELALLSPEGILIRCQRRAANDGRSPALGAAQSSPDANQNHLLQGTYCGFAGARSSTGSTSRTTRVQFDGRGRFAVASESSFNVQSGLGYGNSATEGGTYTVTAARPGATIHVRWNTGEVDGAVVHHMGGGRITEIRYGDMVLGQGLCGY